MRQLLHRPPVYFALAVLAQLGLDYYWPVQHLIPFFLLWIGTFFFAAGALLIAFAIGRFRRADAPTDPYATPHTLVTSGVYAYSRNPIYLGLALVLVGLAWRLSSLSPWLIIPLFLWVIDHHFIRPEEERMEKIFGAPYTAYRQQVRRWL